MKAIEKNLRAGAALVESCLAIIMLCLILFGILQISYLVAAKDVISFSAFAGCRSATVGMKEDFVSRVVRVTGIPIAGPLVNNRNFIVRSPDRNRSGGQTWDRALAATPSSEQYWMEQYAIPFYLGASDSADLNGILNYYNWLNMGTLITASTRYTSDSVEVSVSQNVPLSFPFARAFYRGNIGTVTRQDGTHSVPHSPITANLTVENHSALYLTDD